MSEFAEMENSSSKMENENGLPAANQSSKTLDWTELLKPENGGPGEPLGRLEAVAAAEVRTAARIAKFGEKKAKGSSKPKPGLAIGRKRAKEMGL